MSTQNAESPSPVPSAANPFKLLKILAGGAFALSLVTASLAALLFLRSGTEKMEQGNVEIKEAIEASSASLAKKVDALQSACIDWQAVLKTASDKPDATFKIVKTADGLLTLAEVQAAAPEGSAPQEQKK